MSARLRDAKMSVPEIFFLANRLHVHEMSDEYSSLREKNTPRYVHATKNDSSSKTAEPAAQPEPPKQQDPKSAPCFNSWWERFRPTTQFSPSKQHLDKWESPKRQKERER